MKKIGLLIVFGLGFSIVVITAVRFKYFFEVDARDLTYTLWRQGVLSGVVPLLGIVNANLPVMQPALKKTFGPLRMLSTIHHHGGSKANNNNKRSDGASSSGGAALEFDNILSSSSGRRFRRLPEDAIGLTTIGGGNNTGNITHETDSGVIRVTTDWEVHSMVDSGERETRHM
ncbi:hypothetical protein F5Y17DRAFT_426905 [Xylariaceae sp. FL0594]|nr:hypothetical protein F5Y17DRAFT_426905 [Xylariaceae sp. FL0594]